MLITACLFVAPAFADYVQGTVPAVIPAPAADITAVSSSSLTPTISDVGKISWSIDGLGVYPGTTGTIQVEKPSAGATVKKAYMAAASTGFSYHKIVAGDIKIDTQNVVFTQELASDIHSYNYWGDVTSLVKTKLDAAPAGRVDFAITETPAYDTDGELLVVIFNDPAQTTDNTILLMFGAQKIAGDDFNIGLADPLDLTHTDKIDMSLASSFSNQEGNTGQYSIVNVNGVRMTTSAGGNDDGTTSMSNGNLFTVGGLDDSNTNPADAYAIPTNKRADDELYTLMPFVKNGDTQIKVHTQNPSNDDNILFAGIFIKGATAVVGEGIILSPASATNYLGETHTLTATVQDDNGNPVVGKVVTFTVTAGPNAGKTGTATTDATGKAQFSYVGNTVGTDTIVATFGTVSSTQVISSNEATKEWKTKIPNVPEFPTLAVPLGMLIGIVFLVYSFKGKNE